MHRGDKGELVEDFVATDVAGVKDEVDSGKGFVHLRTY
jgi:hypothetical protein